MMNPTYNCTQTGLTQAGTILFQNALVPANLARLAAYKPYYTPDYCNQQLLLIAEAKSLRSAAARALPHEEARITLVEIARNCRYLWQGLKNYITTSVPENARSENYNSAGQSQYTAASADNWIANSSLLEQGANYIADNINRLIANNNMPATFQEVFLAAQSDFQTQWNIFLHTQSDATVGTQTKIEANNRIYATMIQLSTDGQYVFQNNEEMRKQFSFSHIIEMIEPTGASTAIIEVTNNVTNLPIVAEIQVQGTDRITFSNEDGEASLSQLAAGATTFIVKADGFTETTITKQLNTGTTSRFTVSLQPLFTGEMTIGPEQSPPVTSQVPQTEHANN